MKAVVAWVVKTPSRATIIATLAAALSPPLKQLGPLVLMGAVLSGVVMALVVLRFGLRCGASVLVPPLAVALLGYLATGSPSVLGPMLLAVALSAVLRVTRSFSGSIHWGVALTVVLVLGFDQWQPLLAESDQKFLETQLVAALKQQQSRADMSLDLIVQYVQPMALGIWVTRQWLLAFLCLCLARYFQALLYNPGGFGQEFRTVRLSRFMALTTLVVLPMVVYWYPDVMLLAPVLVTLSLIAGISLVHALVHGKEEGGAQGTVGILLLFYACLIFLSFLSVLLILAAWLDSFVNFRQRLYGKVS